jgi:hypothetical protein
MTSLTSAEPRATAVPDETNMAQPTVSNRFLLWIDAVGGYLVCTGDRVRIGQLIAGNTVELPIIADLARHHATLRRDGESYLVEPVHGVRLNGRAIDRTMLVSDGTLVELGRGVQLRFRQPNPLSTTACLEIVSRHRTQPTTTGIVLMAETCLLGPAANSHIVCRNWSRNVVLHRLQDSLYCVTEGTFTIDGAVCERRGLVTPGRQVVGGDFTFSVESC